MKRVLFAILLWAVLLCPSFVLAAGTISDPVVTKTFVDGKVENHTGLYLHC